MNNELIVSHSKTHTGLPLVTLDGLPGGSADLTPDQLRALAAVLVRIAFDCDRQMRQTRPLSARRIHYTVAAP